MPRAALLLLALPLSGCFIPEAIDGLTDPLTALGLVLGAEEPTAGDAELSDVGLEPGTAMTLFLADATQVTDIENAPVNGADVWLDGTQANRDGNGTYSILPTGGLEYQAGAGWDLHVELGEYVADAGVHLPQAMSWTAPSNHAVGADLVVDGSGQGYDSVLVVVFDTASGAVTFSNEPRTAGEVYDFTHGSSAVTVTVPGSEAFPTAGGYLIGTAGLEHTRAADLDEMNTVLSTLMAGLMRFAPVTVQ